MGPAAPELTRMSLRPLPLTDDALRVALRRRFVEAATAPLDGMWLCGLAPAGTHTGLFLEGRAVGYYCIGEGEHLLQFHVDSPHRAHAAAAFEDMLRQQRPHGAYASTAEPGYISLCLDHFSTFEVNARMYQHQGSEGSTPPPPLRCMPESVLDEVVAFAHAALGGPRDWLTGYYQGLLARRELHGAYDGATLVGLGESRGFQGLQDGYADLGVIVAKDHRCRGVATWILSALVHANDEHGLQSICSTEATNLAAQKAITRAGFTARNRLVRFSGLRVPAPSR